MAYLVDGIFMRLSTQALGFISLVTLLQDSFTTAYGGGGGGEGSRAIASARFIIIIIGGGGEGESKRR